nr:fumarylacetoacetate hydrolase family protein [Rhodococcus sp. 06-621-2]
MLFGRFRNAESLGLGAVVAEVIVGSAKQVVCSLASRLSRDIGVADASSHIAGVAISNDLSARDVQAIEMSALVGPAKGKNCANVIGPAVLTYDEVDLAAVRVTASVNENNGRKDQQPSSRTRSRKHWPGPATAKMSSRGNSLPLEQSEAAAVWSRTAGSNPAISSSSPPPESALWRIASVAESPYPILPRFELFPSRFAQT